MYKRTLKLVQTLETKSIILTGPRQTGKSTLLRAELPDALFIDLLEADTFRRLVTQPEVLREFVEFNPGKPVVIDEIQKIPPLLDEVHRLIERDKKLRFILTGSSARKLRREGVNLLGGRARRLRLHPLTALEINLFHNKHKLTLSQILQWGSLPSILTSKTPKEDLKDYVGTYLMEEIQAESLVRSLSSFSRFLDATGLINTEKLNYSAVASDVALPSKTVQEYFKLLEDTLIGALLPPYLKTKTRKAMTSPKFYLFDLGVANAASGRWSLDPKTPEYGKAFEHFVWRELTSYLDYLDHDSELTYWRSENKLEVDFILQKQGAKAPFCAIEVKAKSNVSTKELVGLRAFAEEFPKVRKLAVSLEAMGRKTEDGIEIWPIQNFLEKLWNLELF